MTERPRPKPRARAPAAPSTSSNAVLSSGLSTPPKSASSITSPPQKRPYQPGEYSNNKDDDDDIFAYQRNLQRRKEENRKKMGLGKTLSGLGEGSGGSGISGGSSFKKTQSDPTLKFGASGGSRSGSVTATSPAKRQKLNKNPSTEPKAIDEDDEEDIAEKGKGREKNGNAAPIILDGSSDDGIEIVEDLGRGKRASSRIRSRTSTSPFPQTSTTSKPGPSTSSSSSKLPSVPENPTLKPTTPHSDEDEDPSDFHLPEYTARMEAMRARHAARQVLTAGGGVMVGSGSGSGSGNGDGEGRDDKIDVMVTPELTEERLASLSVLEREVVGRKMNLPVERVNISSPLRMIYEKCASKLSIPVDDITMVMEDGTKIWSPDVRPVTLRFGGDVLNLTMYETKHYETIEKERDQAERARLDRLAAEMEEWETSPARIATTKSGSGSGSGSMVKDAGTGKGNGSNSGGAGVISLDDDEDDDIPTLVAALTSTSRQQTPANDDSAPAGDVILIQLRGAQGAFEVKVKSTTAFGTLISHYAKKYNLPENVPGSGRGRNHVKAKVLKIDFDGELFDGQGTIGDIDIEEGESLDVKYVGV